MVTRNQSGKSDRVRANTVNFQTKIRDEDDVPTYIGRKVQKRKKETAFRIQKVLL